MSLVIIHKWCLRAVLVCFFAGSSRPCRLLRWTMWTLPLNFSDNMINLFQSICRCTA